MSLITNTNNIFMKGVIGNVRKAQEDSHDIKMKTPNGDVFVVCDGMGGHVGGAKASSLAVESIIDHLKKEKYADPLAALDGALQFANMQILGFAASNPEYKGMGTTACIVLLQSDEAYIAHVGDSRIYLYLGKEKELHRITKDHSYVQTLVDAGQITDDEAEHHPNKNRILKAVGIMRNLQPSFNKAKPKNGDIFLICSDGLCGMIPDSTIENVLGQKRSLEERGEMLISLAMQGETVQPGGQDNCTLELIQIDNSPWPESEFVSYNPSKPQKVEKKRKSPKTVIILAVVLVLIAALGVTGIYVKNNKREKNKIQEEISKIDAQIKEKNDSISSIKLQCETSYEQISKAERDIEEYKDQPAQRKEAENQKKNHEEKINRMNNDIKRMESDVENLGNEKETLENKKKR